MAENYPMSQQAQEQHIDFISREWIGTLISIIATTCVYPTAAVKKGLSRIRLSRKKATTFLFSYSTPWIIGYFHVGLPLEGISKRFLRTEHMNRWSNSVYSVI